jgi:sulfide:quinone oxidoreductase
VPATDAVSAPASLAWAHVHDSEPTMRSERVRVVIVGGGVAAVEALLALRQLAGHQLQITLVTPDREFVYRPVTVGEPFERTEARAYSLSGMVGDAGGARLVWDWLEAVDADSRVICTRSGARIAYDILVIALGAIAREPLPGALTFRGRGDVVGLRVVLDELVAGTAKSVALTLPSERMWPLPIYELTLMTAAHLRDRGVNAPVWLVTPEEEPLALFGPAATGAVEPMLRAQGVRTRTSSRPALVRPRVLVLAGGAELHVDRVITVPRLDGPSLPGLPHDQHGFIPVDDHGRVRGMDNVFAAGDVTAFPLKQGGLAAQQADSVAETIASELGVPISPQPFSPVLRGLLITQGAPVYLRAEPQRLARGQVWRSTRRRYGAPRPRRRRHRASHFGGRPRRSQAGISRRSWRPRVPSRCPRSCSPTDRSSPAGACRKTSATTRLSWRSSWPMPMPGGATTGRRSTRWMRPRRFRARSHPSTRPSGARGGRRHAPPSRGV